jgi:hypothetical protein
MQAYGEGLDTCFNLFVQFYDICGIYFEDAIMKTKCFWNSCMPLFVIPLFRLQKMRTTVTLPEICRDGGRVLILKVRL